MSTTIPQSLSAKGLKNFRKSGFYDFQVAHFIAPPPVFRQKTIADSLYKSELKTLLVIDEECLRISRFVQARRGFWNFDPLEGAFSLTYEPSEISENQ